MSEEIIHRLRWRQPVPHARKDGSWFTIEWSGAQVMAIVNVTPDSFSDGGAYDSVEAATEAGRDAWREGALIVDVGGSRHALAQCPFQSTRNEGVSFP